MKVFKALIKKIKILRLKREIMKLEKLRTKLKKGTLERTVLDSILPTTKQAYNSLEK